MLSRPTAGLFFFLLLIGCASEDAANPKGDGTASPSSSSSQLDACALPNPCAWPVSSGSPSEADGPRCVISELAAGRALSVDTKLVADGPQSDCEVHQQLYFFAEKNVAYDVWRKKCGATEERVVKRCTMLSKDAYTKCGTDFDGPRTSTGGIKCSLPSEWMSECQEVDAASCP